ncbi:MAG TPA: hypothetical protein VD788_05825, partial [Candidatus Polarisedimenticolaceae bacterium]|nr:hypothetical protein [Candidatus Polarisedimenticolaceae bacterium]
MRLRHRRTPVVAATLALTALAAAHAASARRPASPLDPRIQHRRGGSVATLPRELASLDPSDPLRRGWEEFRARHGGDWSVYLDERTAMPTLVSGRGVSFGSGEIHALDELDRRARRFLGEHAALLGDASELLELDLAASRRLREDHWQLVYRQRVDGVRVENARLDLHVVRGRLVMLGASQWGRPTTDGLPALESGPARALLDGYLGAERSALVAAAPPELVLIAVDAAPADEPRAWSGPRGEGLAHLLVWRFRFDEIDAPAHWIGEVDAHDGSVLAFYEATQQASVRGGVFPISTDGDCLTGGCEVAGFPLPFADYTETGTLVEFTDDYGNLACDASEAEFVTRLDGPYVRIVDACGPTSEPGSCADGVDLGLKHGTNCDVAPGSSAGNTAAARTAFYHVNR